jgi:hypothetical protein
LKYTFDDIFEYVAVGSFENAGVFGTAFEGAMFLFKFVDVIIGIEAKSWYTAEAPSPSCSKFLES